MVVDMKRVKARMQHYTLIYIVVAATNLLVTSAIKLATPYVHQGETFDKMEQYVF